MLIAWGQRVKRQPLGWVADYCVFCREARCFELIGVSAYTHVYFIQLGSSNLLGHEARCTVCNTSVPVDAAIFRKVSDTPDDLDTLIHATQPDIEQRYAVHRAFVAGRPALSSELRRQLIIEPFLLLANAVERRFAATHLDRYSVGAILGTPTVFIGAIVAARLVLGPAPELPWVAIGWVGVAAFVLLLAVLATETQRFLGREVLPRLARSLSPVASSPAEIEEALQHLRRLKLKVGSRISRARLERSIERYQSAQPRVV